MSDPKSIVTDFFAAASREGIDVLRRFATSGMTFWAPGPGEIDLETYLSMVDTFIGSKSREPIRFTVHDIISEGDKVAVEVESYCRMNSGKIYNNKYHFKILVRDGKIDKIREYHDTHHATDALDLGH